RALGGREVAGLAQDLVRDRELAEVVETAGKPDELDLLGVDADPRGDPRCELADAERPAGHRSFALVDRVRQARRRPPPDSLVDRPGEATQRAEPKLRRSDTNLVLASLLCGVQGAVGPADKVGVVSTREVG